jgi:hypothetical protein
MRTPRGTRGPATQRRPVNQRRITVPRGAAPCARWQPYRSKKRSGARDRMQGSKQQRAASVPLSRCGYMP